MTFTRFVTIGRIVLINYGPDCGKIATIIDVVDQNKALIDGPISVTGVKRQMISFKRLALTDIRIHVPRLARERTLKALLEKNDVVNKWNKTAWAQKIAKKAVRAEANDFDRFKHMILKKKKSRMVKKAVAASRKK